MQCGVQKSGEFVRAYNTKEHSGLLGDVFHFERHPEFGPWLRRPGSASAAAGAAYDPSHYTGRLGAHWRLLGAAGTTAAVVRGAIPRRPCCCRRGWGPACLAAGSGPRLRAGWAA